MINQELLTYVRGQLRAGTSRTDIIKALATGGWNEGDAQEAFDAIEKESRPPMPPPSAPKPAAPAPQQGIGIGEAARMAQGKPTQPPQPAAPNSAPKPQPAAPAPAPEPVAPRLQIDTRPIGTPHMAPKTTAPAAPRKGRAPWGLILTLLLIVLVAAGGYLFYPQILGGVNAAIDLVLPQQTAPADDFPIDVITDIPDTTVPTVGTTTATGTPVEQGTTTVQE